jgi:small subunit ribosomal protein S15
MLIFKMPKIKKSTDEKKNEKPVWLKYTKEELNAIILKLAGKNITSEKIGLILRDQYGIPKSSIYGIKISEVLKEKDKFNDPDITNLEKKLEKIINHYKKNKQDKNAERSLIITKAKVKKRKEYKEKRT